MSLLMNREEGNSFNRIYGFEGMRYPNRIDYDRVRNIFKKLSDGFTLAYHNGMKVSEEQLARVQDRI
jgi:hypothetical protein